MVEILITLVVFGFLIFTAVSLKPSGPVKNDPFEVLFSEGRTMGTLIVGRPGTGKTSFLARQIMKEFMYEPDHAIFILDWSGSVTDMVLQMAQQEGLEERIIYDELGNHEWVVPMPEFAIEYGPLEEQCQRVASNLAKLAPYLVTGAPVIGGLAIREIGPQFFRLLCAITNQHGENWQVTEAKRLILEKGLRKSAIFKFGHHCPEAKYYFEKVHDNATPSEQDLRVYALSSMLGVVEPKEIRARLGYYRPGWTVKEAIEKGMLVIVNGANLINQPNAQNYLFTQVYSLILQEINRRTPGDPNNTPVSLILDEVAAILENPGMAEDVGKISPIYRSRKLQLVVVVQSLAQLSKELLEKIWSLGNKVVFGVENKDDAEKFAHQLFAYDPKYTKQPARNMNQNPITEPEKGQDRILADWIQRLNFRECLIRRFYSERELDPYIRHISKTMELPHGELPEPLTSYKERLLLKRAVRVRDALDLINQRNLVSQPPSVP